MQPTFRNLTESFEGWAYRSGLSRRLSELEKERLVERGGGSTRVHRLTAAGRVHALGGRDPDTCWSRHWDGCWRLVCFDIPTTKNSHRRHLRHYLHSLRFGLLQRSIWITPDPVDEQAQRLHLEKIDARSLVLMEARACGGESDVDIVRAAWDFSRINELYTKHLRILEKRPTAKVKNNIQARALLGWAHDEHKAWIDAVRVDPLLPAVLLPSDYLGRRAWQGRVKQLAKIKHAIAGFQG